MKFDENKLIRKSILELAPLNEMYNAAVQKQKQRLLGLYDKIGDTIPESAEKLLKKGKYDKIAPLHHFYYFSDSVEGLGFLTTPFSLLKLLAFVHWEEAQLYRYSVNRSIDYLHEMHAVRMILEDLPSLNGDTDLEKLYDDVRNQMSYEYKKWDNPLLSIIACDRHVE